MAAEFHQGSSVWPDGFQGLPPGGVLRFQGRRWNMLDDRDAEDDQRSPDNVEVPPAGWTAEERRFAHQAAQLFATYYNSRIRQMSASWRSHIQETYLDALFNHANLGGIAELLSGFFSCNTVIVSSDGTPICFNRNETKNFSPKVQSQLNAWYPRALEIESPSDLHRIYPELKNQQPWVHNGYVAPIQGASGRARGALLLWNADSEFGARQHNGSGAYIPPEFPPFLKPAVKDMARHLGILLERDAALPRYPGETERWNRLRLAWYRLVDLHRPHRGHPLPPPLQRLLRDAVYAVVGLEPAQDQAATKLNTSKTTLVRHCRELLHDPNATWPRLRKKAPAAPDINDEIERLEGLVRHIQELAAD